MPSPDPWDHDDPRPHPVHFIVKAGTPVQIDWTFPDGSVYREEYTAPPLNVREVRLRGQQLTGSPFRRTPGSVA